MSTDAIAVTIACPDTPAQHWDCDSAHLTLAAGEDGKNAGRYGIRPGHAASMFALGIGPLDLFRKNQLIFSAVIHNGIAVFKDNTLTIAADSFEETSAQTV